MTFNRRTGTRRPNRNAFFRPSQQVSSDPFIALGARLAWRADDAIDNGSTTTSIPGYIGGVTLPTQTGGQAIKAASPAFGGRYTITFTGGTGYGNVEIWPATPANATIVTVGRSNTHSTGLCAVTVTGSVNTGFDQRSVSGAVLGSTKVATVGSQFGISHGVNTIMVSVFTAAGATTYVNSKVPTTGSFGAALTGSHFHIGALSTNNVWPLVGEWAATAIWDRALTQGEVAYLLEALAVSYGQTSTRLFMQIQDAFPSYHLFTAEHMNTSGFTKVGGFVDWNNTGRTLSQGTAASQVDVPVTSSAFGNQHVATFAGSQSYQSNQAASTWKFLHDGTGSEVFIVGAFNSTASYAALYSTADGGGQNGVTSYVKSGSGAMRFSYYNLNAPSVNYSFDPAAPALPPYSTPGTQRHLFSGSTYEHHWNSQFIRTGTGATPASASNPSYSLILGAISNMRWLDGNIAAALFLPSLTSGSRSLVESWISEKYFMASLEQQVKTICAGKPFFKADNYTLDGVSGKVAAFVDLNDATHVLTQSTASNQCNIPAVSGSNVMNGAVVANFVQSSTKYRSNRAASAWDFLSDGSGFRSFYVGRVISGSNPACSFFSTNNLSSPTTGFDTDYGDSAATTTLYARVKTDLSSVVAAYTKNVDQVISDEVVGTPTATVKKWRNGSQVLNTTKTSTGGVAVGTLAVNTDTANSNGFSGNQLFKALFFTPANLTAAQEAIIRRYILLLSGIST